MNKYYSTKFISRYYKRFFSAQKTHRKKRAQNETSSRYDVKAIRKFFSICLSGGARIFTARSSEAIFSQLRPHLNC